MVCIITPNHPNELKAQITNLFEAKQNLEANKNKMLGIENCPYIHANLLKES